MIERIEAMIRETERWQIQHRNAGRKIEAAACAIRRRALEDALKEIRRV